MDPIVDLEQQNNFIAGFPAEGTGRFFYLEQ